MRLKFVLAIVGNLVIFEVKLVYKGLTMKEVWKRLPSHFK